MKAQQAVNSLVTYVILAYTGGKDGIIDTIHKT